MAIAEPTAAASLDEHPCFTPWRDPQSGFLSYVLSKHIAPIQRVLYYITPSVCGPNHYLWFRCFFPPSRTPYTAVVDLRAGNGIRYFPQTAGHLTDGGTPLVSREGDTAYVPVGDTIYLLSADGTMREIGRMPADILKGRHLFRLATELTMSCDGKHLLLDSHIGNRWLISLMNVENGEVTPLRWFSLNHTHAAFSLHDPTLFQLNQGHGHDPITGERYEMDVRMWLMNTQLTRYEPVDPGLWFSRNSLNCHEWWTPSGTIQFCDYEHGIFEINLQTRRKELIWPHPLVHGQCHPGERYLCGDQNPYNWNERLPCSVWVFDRKTRREIAVVSQMPAQPLPWRDFRPYHIDPHPHFSADGQWLIYTTTALGKVSVALAPVRQFDQLLNPH